jgi:hypothetical protein
LTVLSNEDPNEKLLDSLLNHDVGHGPLNAAAKVTQGHAGVAQDRRPNPTLPQENDNVKIDITLRTQMGQPPLIMLLFTVVNDNYNFSTSSFPFQLGVRKVSINFEIGLNGRITVTHVVGLWGDDPGEHEVSGSTRKMQAIQAQLIRVLETSEDIGILVEWVLQQPWEKSST